MATRILCCIQNSYTSSTTDEYVQGLCRSWALPSLVLAGIRAVFSIYAFVVLFYQIGFRLGNGQAAVVQQSFSYFTVLGYWGLAFYFAFASAHTISYSLSGRAWLQSWPSVLRWLHSVFYASVMVYPFIVTAVYWSLLSEAAFETEFSTWSNISQHAMNSGFAFFEVILPRSSPHPWVNLSALVVILACYLGLAYLTHATEGVYVYDFLDPASGAGSVTGYCFAILAACIVIFVVVRYIQVLRNWLCQRCGGRQGNRTQLEPITDSNTDIEMGHVQTKSVNF
ncbi:hypothetical protein DOTSEDRAFT_177538 [Dothistroma septosporum NZE10]|uniref:FAR-17a/AIG1-like protein n=1 Tax=Dothistroma septosporum (strain NZE10 / CBS 128990) TaxID=675120 RepID=N1PD39_DOTSN|nr:hypothetical protein DOTSEDRAFT_177538 [Dothistroma septosporum NZE10]